MEWLIVVFLLFMLYIGIDGGDNLLNFLDRLKDILDR